VRSKEGALHGAWEAVRRTKTRGLAVEVRERRIGPGKRVAIAVVTGRHRSSKRLEEGSR